MAIRSCTGAVPVLPLVGERVFSCRSFGAVVALLAACGGGSGAPARDDASAVHDGSAAVRYSSAAVHDDAGRAVALAPVPRRIVSLLPSATELVVALGGGERLIARTSYDEHPALAHLPSFGHNLEAGVEAILALDPDLVIVPPDYLTSGLARRLAAVGVRVYEADAQRMDGVLATVTRLGTLLGEDGRGDSLHAALRAGLAAVRAESGRARAVTAVYVVWHSPPYVAGAETYVDDLIRAAGGRNAFGDVRGWSEVSAEALIARDPEVVIVPQGDGSSLRPEWLLRAPGWRALRAVREGRLVVVDAGLFNRPGPRVVEAASALATALNAERAP